MDGSAAVAQLDRVLGYEPRGRGFESCQPRQQNQGLSLFTLGRPRAPGNTGETERLAECLQDSSDCNLIAELIVSVRQRNPGHVPGFLLLAASV
jgi:hypothetical protein